MFDHWITKCFCYSLFLYVIVRQTESTVIGRNDAYESIINEQGLYNASDNVVVLNATNFKSTILNSKTAYLVEFYNSWCGFCQRYAPTWKAFASSVVEWNDVVQVGAIDCANDDNNPICREYDIMHYPVVRYFSISDNSKGTDLENRKNEGSLTRELVEKLHKDQQDEKGTSWPILLPFRSNDLEDVWRAAPEEVKYIFFLFEDKDSMVGPEVILDMHRLKTLQIRRIMSDNESLCMANNVSIFPTLIVIDRKKNQSRLKISVPSRVGIVQIIKEFMESKGLSIQTEKPSVEFTRIENQNGHDKQSQQEKTNISTRDVIYQTDLESALRYSLEREIPLKAQIEGVRMEALKKYLKALSKYFPMKRGNSNYLPSIYNKIKDESSISGEKFREIVKTTEEVLSPVYYSEKKEWIGCKGSEARFRGYPCGLWTLFHTLTVNHASHYESEDPEAHQPTEILTAMHGYIQNFFGCADCAEHFIKMAKEEQLSDVEFADDAILWLWRAHNTVNIRLSGDETEDPKFPKVRYPPREFCEPCRNHDYTWNENEVLVYLKRKYGYSGIVYNSDTRRSVDNEGAFEPRRLPLADSRYVTTQRRMGWDFTIFDISICVVLYVVSVAILVLVCIKFAVKRSGKKKMSINTLLGRV